VLRINLRLPVVVLAGATLYSPIQFEGELTMSKDHTTEAAARKILDAARGALNNHQYYCFLKHYVDADITYMEDNFLDCLNDGTREMKVFEFLEDVFIKQITGSTEELVSCSPA
jgi:hypothetical protein